MKKLFPLLLLVVVNLAAFSAENPAAKFRKNYQLLRMIGAASSDRDARSLIVLDRRFAGYCKFFADQTNEGSAIIFAELCRQDGSIRFSFTVSQQGTTLDDKETYTRKERRLARRFYRTLTHAARQKKF